MNSTANQRVLVTGATGFVGRSMVDLLSSEGIDTLAVGRSPAPRSFKVPYRQIDWENEESLREILKNTNYVVHLAGVAHSGAITSNYTKYNVGITKRLIEACVENEVERFLFISSSLVSKKNTQELANDYARSKQQAEKEIIRAVKNSATSATILRPVNIYGAGMKGNIVSMISLIWQRRLPRLPVLKNQISLIGATDVCRAILLALDSNNTAGKTYTVTDGESYSISAIEEEIYRSLGRKMPVLRVPHVVLSVAATIAGFVNTIGSRQGGISGKTYRNLVEENLHSNEDFVRDTGFTPTTTFLDELPAIISTITKNNID